MRSSLRHGLGPALLALALVAAPAAPARAKVFMSRKEALAWAFPDADRVESRAVALTAEQAGRVEALAKSRLESRIVNVYTAHRGDAVVGHAFIDVHTVRTMPEAFLVVLTPEGAVRSLRVLAFYEPQEYRPADRWVAQFEGKGPADDLHVGGAIHGIAGSTLTARAVAGGVRRSLALFEVLVRGGGGD